MKRYSWIAAAVVLVDQLVKTLARRLTGPVTLIPGVIGLQYSENTGMAFSLLNRHTWLLTLLSAAIIVVGWLVLRRYTLGRLSKIATMLMLGGAVGNLIDRLFVGYVVDMFEVLLFRFAIFNVADMALTIGGALLAVTLLFFPKDWSLKHGDTKDRMSR